jgi:hypothetical protein
MRSVAESSVSELQTSRMPYGVWHQGVKINIHTSLSQLTHSTPDLSRLHHLHRCYQKRKV